MPRLNFTVRAIDAIRPPETGRVEYWDESLPGFGLRVSPEGRRSWVVMYWFGGRQRRLTLGTYPNLPLADARQKAKDALYGVAKGTDPATEKQIERQAETFGELAAEYLTRHAKLKKKTWKEDERILDREFLPLWKYAKAKAVTRREVIHLLDQIVERGAPIQANRALALIRKVFNFGIQRSILEMNPCWNVPAPTQEKTRDRVLTEDEIRALWKTMDAEPTRTGNYFRMLLLTAQRPGEVLAMEWGDVDFANACWSIPSHKAKNGLTHRVPLNRAAALILKELRLSAKGEPWVFVSPTKAQPLQNVKKTLAAIRLASKVQFRPHDLRRTAASYMTGMGIPRLTVSKILNHVETSVTAVYDRHSYDAEKREAVDRWAVRLKEILAKRPELSEGLFSTETTVLGT